MKAISLHPEPAMNVAEGRKWIETRPRRCNYRGRFAVQATLPLGAVVASAVLTDCVPIVERDTWEGVEATGPRIIRISPAPATLWRYRDDGSVGDLVTDQLPFGDFSPGRWALLLDDIKPTTERCPYCWGDGDALGGDVEFDDDEAERWPACPVCYGHGDCDPVRVRGQQAVPWEWTP